MKKIILIFLCFFSIVIHQRCSAQHQNKIDSLLQVLKTEKEDTSKANTLNLLGKESYLKGDYEQTRKYSKEAFTICEKLNFEKGKITAYLNTGITYFLQSNYSEALKNYLAALAISEKLNDKKNIANCNNNMGLVYTYQGNYPKALKLHFAALKSYQEIGDTKGLINSYNNIGIIYDEQGNYIEALKSYYACLKIAEDGGDKKAIADAYLNIGHINVNEKNIAEAMQNYTDALKLYEEIGYKQGVGDCYANLVQGYTNQKNYKKALEVNLKAIEILEAIGAKMSTLQTKDVRATLYLAMSNYAEALKLYFVNLKEYQEMGDSINVTSSYNSIGFAYFKQNKYDEAINYFNQGLLLAKEVGAKDKELFCYKTLAESYEKKNDFRNAYGFHKLYFAMNDSLFNEKRSEQISELKARYDSEKKDNEITLLSKEKVIKDGEIKKQKLLKYSFIFGLGLTIVLLLFGYRTFRIRQALRLQDIRNKIAGDLHDDIGSTLNSISIYSEVAKKKDEQQEEALEMIGDASRKIIDAMGDIVWTINPDNDSFEKIIFRMKSLAYNLFRAKKIEFIFRADETLNEKKLTLEQRRNFFLIFKESINNIVKYAEATSASIVITDEKDSIKLHIEDNGVGFDTTQEIIGNGVKSMNRRAAEMKAQFKIKSSKGVGTQIELILKS